MEVELMVKTFDLTSNASFITYRIETLIKMKTSKKMIYNFVELEKKTGSFPLELEFVTGFYDEQTGSSGSLFRNTKLDNYILAYTGTNYYFDREKDLYADVVGICLGQGEHYPPCYRFYKRMTKKYGENIILTGHSLGGNIAMRVALEYNVKETIVYNAAPLYLKDGVNIFMTPDMDEVLYSERLTVYNRKIKNQEIELEININNGFCKSKTTYNNNNRVKKARIYVYDIPLIDAQIGTYVKDDTVPLEIGVYEINLEDTMTLQTFFHKVTLKNTSKEGHVGLFFKFEILEVYKGEKYSDTCISEFAAYATLSN